MAFKLRVLAAICAALTYVGCNDESLPSTVERGDGGNEARDAGRTGTDAAAATDGGADSATGTDAGTTTPVDSGRDARADAGPGLEPLPLDDSGFTVLEPAADSVLIYVSSSEGDDARDGRAPERAVRTVARGKALLPGNGPHWLLFKRGDTFEGALGNWRIGGRSHTEPMVIGAYGEGERPVLRGAAPDETTFGKYVDDDLSHIVLTGLHLEPVRTAEHTWMAGVLFFGPGGDILIEDCHFEGFADALLFEATAEGRLHDITVRRSVIVDSYPWTDGAGSGESRPSLGIYGYGVDRFTVEENVIDHNGWTDRWLGEHMMFSHNIYFWGDVTGAVIRGNILSNASSHGLSINWDVTVEDNLFVKNALGAFVRTAPSVVRDNVFTEPRDLFVGGGERGWGLTVGQSWNGEGGLVSEGGDATIEGNIFAHNRLDHGFAIGLDSNVASRAETVIVRGNTCYDWASTCIAFNGPRGDLFNYYDRAQVEGNIFQQTQAFALVTLNATSFEGDAPSFAGNTYYSSAAPDAWLDYGGPRAPLTELFARTGESDASTTDPSLPEPSRSVASYHASLGRAADTEAFLTEARNQRKGNWRPAYTAHVVNDYFRAGLRAPSSPPR